MSVLCLLPGKRKESWGALMQMAKVANEEIDVSYWSPPLRVVTETNSHGSLEIHCWCCVIMRARHSGRNDTVWLPNGHTWTLTLYSLDGDEAVAHCTSRLNGANLSLLGHWRWQANLWCVCVCSPYRIDYNVEWLHRVAPQSYTENHLENWVVQSITLTEDKSNTPSFLLHTHTHTYQRFASV